MQIGDIIEWRSGTQVQRGRLLRYQEGKLLVRLYLSRGSRDVRIRTKVHRPKVVRSEAPHA